MNLLVDTHALLWWLADRDSDEEARFEPLPISYEHAEAAGALPTHHNDPFDGMLIAQAQILGVAIVTRDSAFRRYDVDVIGC